MNITTANIFETLLNCHTTFLENTISHRRFKHKDIVEILNRYDHKFPIKVIGRSVEDKTIYLVTIGSGATRILLWSQMHGDEPTATMAIIDILRFFSSDHFEDLKDLLKRELTIFIIPMLNPDGVDIYTRRNAIGIDLNRDAKILRSPEANLFKKIYDEIKPHFAFNLHDQNPRYTVGDTTEIAAISFLAPPYDFSRSINNVREKAMKVIAGLNQQLQKVIPGKVGKFSDEYEVRAFGDNIQSWGTSTILVESGGFENDREKQYLRKLNFALLLTAFHSIATKEYLAEDFNSYNLIPLNTRNVYDFIIRNAQIISGKERYLVDIGINRYEYPIAERFYFKSKVEEFGDLSNYRGLEELDASGMIVARGKCYEHVVKESLLSKHEALAYLSKGYTSIVIDRRIEEESETKLPVNLTNKYFKQSGISIDSAADLLLWDESKLKKAIVNGFSVDFESPQELNFKGLFVP